MEQTAALCGFSLWLAPLGFPRGEAGFFDKRHFGTDWKKRLMRGGDSLVYECSWMSGIRSGFLHSTGKSKTFSHRHPSSVSPAGSEEPSWLTASPRGKPRGGCGSWFYSTFCSIPGAGGSVQPGACWNLGLRATYEPTSTGAMGVGGWAANI